MTSFAEANEKYGHVVQSAGMQVFGIEKTAWCGRQEEKLKIGTPDGFLRLDVILNQPDNDAILRERAADIAKYACELRTNSLRLLSASALRTARK